MRGRGQGRGVVLRSGRGLGGSTYRAPPSSLQYAKPSAARRGAAQGAPLPASVVKKKRKKKKEKKKTVTQQRDKTLEPSAPA